MHTNAVDARRAMALVEQAEADGGADGYTPTATSLSAEAAAESMQHGASAAWEATRGGVGGRADDAVTLLRRAEALGVPPLPPDLGAVR